MKHLFTLVLFFFIGNISAQNVGYEIQFNITNYTNDTLIIGYYYGDKQLVRDSLFRKSGEPFLLKGEEALDQGIYLALMKPDNSFIQFLVPEDQHFVINFDANDVSNASYKGSQDNELFSDYVHYLGEKRKVVDDLKLQMEAVDSASTDYNNLKDKVEKVDQEVKKHLEEVISKNPKTLTAMVLKASKEIEIPDFTGTPDEIQRKSFYYYREHYFDNVDFQNEALIRTSFIYTKVDNYFSKLVPMMPDTIIAELDKLFSKLEGNADAYRYFLSHFINQYGAGKYVGVDKIFIHMVDEYVNKGKADWISEESLTKLKEKAEELRPILIGKIFPKITTFLADETPVKLHDIAAEYTLVVFWAPDCGHCKKAMPFIVDFEKQYAEKGLKVLSICTKSGDKLNTCFEEIEAKEMGRFINTGDKYQVYRRQVSVPTTPKIFILDRKKEILIKDIKAEDLATIFEGILKEKVESAN